MGSNLTQTRQKHTYGRGGSELSKGEIPYRSMTC